MNSPRRFYFRVAGEVRGPATVEQLRDFGSVAVVTPDTEVAASAGGPWSALATLAICAEVFPPRPAIEFKATEFEPLNHDIATAMDPNEAQALANRPPASLRGREVLVSPNVLRPARDGDPPNEVQAMVLEVGRRVAANAPVVVLPPPPAKFPRWPWFLAVAVIGTAGILCIPLLYPDRKSDEFTFSILAGWIVLYNGFLVFVMVADRTFAVRMRLRRGQPDHSE